VIGSRAKIKVVKNKVAPPFKTTEVDIMYGTGISREGDLLDIAAAMEIVSKSGSWYSYEGERIGQGRENSKEYIKNNPEFYDLLEKKVKEAIRGDKSADRIKPSSGSEDAE
jgi:recombination protein RecA